MDKDEIKRKIKNLKEKHDILILAHNYQIPEIQDIADFLGDSLDLALKATKTDAEVLQPYLEGYKKENVGKNNGSISSNTKTNDVPVDPDFGDDTPVEDLPF